MEEQRLTDLTDAYRKMVHSRAVLIEHIDSFIGEYKEMEEEIEKLTERVKALEEVVREVARLTWQEDYIGVETPNVRVYIGRGYIHMARELMEQEAA